MTIREFYVQRRRAETPLFLEALRALPEDNLDYKPADASPTARQIVWVMTRQLKSCIDIIKDGKTEWKESEPPAFPQMLEKFEVWSKDLVESVEKMTDADWDRKAEFYYQGKLMKNDP